LSLRDFNLPPCGRLNTLWLNNNKFDNIRDLVAVIAANAPMISFLSIMHNPATAPYYLKTVAHVCAPTPKTSHRLSALISCGQQVQQYRHCVCSRLAHLKFLDDQQISSADRDRHESPVGEGSDANSSPEDLNPDAPPVTATDAGQPGAYSSYVSDNNFVSTIHPVGSFASGMIAIGSNPSSSLPFPQTAR
jgi:hypothetical protein